MYVQSLEISTTDHCNLACLQCNHASPYLRKRFTEVATVARDLRALAGVLSARELRIAGGEPLLHPELEQIIGTVRRIGIAERIVVITNGALLHRSDLRFLRTIDELRVSIYPGISYKFDRAALQSACARERVDLDLRRMNAFSQTMLTRRNDNRRLVNFIYCNCALVHEWSCHLVYEGRFYKCTTAAFMQHRLALVSVPHDSAADGVDLHAGGDLQRRIENYMRSDEPLASCAYCLGTVGRRVSHRQLSRSQLQEELVRDSTSAMASIGVVGLVDSLLLSPLRKTRYYAPLLRTANILRGLVRDPLKTRSRV